MDPKVYFKGMAMLRRLPDMYKEMAVLRKELDELKNK